MKFHRQPNSSVHNFISSNEYNGHIRLTSTGFSNLSWKKVFKQEIPVGLTILTFSCQSTIERKQLTNNMRIIFYDPYW